MIQCRSFLFNFSHGRRPSRCGPSVCLSICVFASTSNQTRPDRQIDISYFSVLVVTGVCSLGRHLFFPLLPSIPFLHQHYFLHCPTLLLQIGSRRAEVKKKVNNQQVRSHTHNTHVSHGSIRSRCTLTVLSVLRMRRCQFLFYFSNFSISEFPMIMCLSSPSLVVYFFFLSSAPSIPAPISPLAEIHDSPID